MYCNKCGASNSSSSEYCIKCGEKLTLPRAYYAENKAAKTQKSSLKTAVIAAAIGLVAVALISTAVIMIKGASGLPTAKAGKSYMEMFMAHDMDGILEQYSGKFSSRQQQNLFLVLSDYYYGDEEDLAEYREELELLSYEYFFDEKPVSMKKIPLEDFCDYESYTSDLEKEALQEEKDYLNSELRDAAFPYDIEDLKYEAYALTVESPLYGKSEMQVLLACVKIKGKWYVVPDSVDIQIPKTEEGSERPVSSALKTEGFLDEVDSIFRAVKEEKYPQTMYIYNNYIIKEVVNSGYYKYDLKKGEKVKLSDFSSENISIVDGFMYFYNGGNVYKINLETNEMKTISEGMSLEYGEVHPMGENLLVLGNTSRGPNLSYAEYVISREGSALSGPETTELRPFYFDADSTGKLFMDTNGKTFFIQYASPSAMYRLNDDGSSENIISGVNEMGTASENWLYFHSNTGRQTSRIVFLNYVNRINVDTNEVEIVFEGGSEVNGYKLYQLLGVYDEKLYGLYTNQKDYTNLTLSNKKVFRYDIKTGELVDLESLGEYTVSASPNLNVREEPTTQSKVIGSLNDGSNVDILMESNGWGKIRWDGGYGWVSMDFVH